MILGKTPPKAMEWGLAPPPHTEKIRSFVTFLRRWLPLAILRLAIIRRHWLYLEQTDWLSLEEMGCC